MTDETPQNKKTEETTETTKEDNLVNSATEAAKRLEEANNELRALLSRKEELVAREALGGRSEAGYITPPKQPETDKEFKERFLKGEVDLLA